MKIQYVSRYISLSEEGLVPELKCPMDQGSLLCNMDENDTIFMYCLSCDYKKYIGTSLYNEIKELVMKIEKN